MKLRSYQSYSMAEALAAVKRDLGVDAVILRTRSWKRGGFLGFGRRTVFEVVAAPAAEVRPKKKETAPAPTRSRRTAGPSRAAVTAYRKSNDVGVPNRADRERTRRLAQALLETHERRKAEQSGAPVEVAAPEPAVPAVEVPIVEPAPVSEPAPVPEPVPLVRATEEQINPVKLDAEAPVAVAAENRSARTEMEPVVDVVPVPEPTPAAARTATETPAESEDRPRRFILRAADSTESAPSAAPRRPEAPDGSPIEDELAAIRSMVGEIMRRQVVSPRRDAGVPTMPQALFDWYMRLIGQDVSEELADRIVNDVRDELKPTELEDGRALRAAVRRHLADYIPVAEEALPSESPDGRPITIALIGPTGVGKTTTLAKLAATFRLREGLRVGLVTADTYRIAAVEQLRTYANIIGVELHVAQTAQEMRDVVERLDDVDVVLIDTAGRGQNDHGRLDELREVLAAAAPHEVHLVLSSTASEKVLLREAEAFGSLGVDKVVMTKLDEAVSFGVLVNVARCVGKDLSYFTTGQEVPDHIESSDAGRLADLVLSGGAV